MRTAESICAFMALPPHKDAKGFESQYDEFYHNFPSALATRLRTTILNAVDQAVETVERVPEDLLRPEVYFICVTPSKPSRKITSGVNSSALARLLLPVLPPATSTWPDGSSVAVW